MMRRTTVPAEPAIANITVVSKTSPVGVWCELCVPVNIECDVM